MGYIMEKEELLPLLNSVDIRICDCRFKLGSPDVGYSEYEKDHITGAVYFDLEKDLSGDVQEHGGRHPLPDLKTLKDRLESKGISNDTILVAYDGGEGSFASRFVWLLSYLGHQKVYVLNGGYRAWKDAGYPIDTNQKEYTSTEYQIDLNETVFASYEKVKDYTMKRPGDTVLIDSRESKRFEGIEEPIDKKAGHIPGAVNKVWTKVLENGYYKKKDDLQANFTDIGKDKEIIVYCGSGVTASPNYVALKEAGFKDVRIYIGSFSDWISYDDNPID
ncbi:Putative thiosulfate sulfurtransferase SseB [Peribacillus sp. Bi96]|uniref:sulfurtransferase n=1 Tax=Peribacillus sp. Bi96 TaxID=2884273 RepID=UPI001D3434F2|nr:sulfurtransferase [Peribacillus sp. Bi96]CAH0187214.1 Putative thiosulfate sulfurtransferase SseB [Peribacillus sp. Bi96]